MDEQRKRDEKANKARRNKLFIERLALLRADNAKFLELEERS